MSIDVVSTQLVLKTLVALVGTGKEKVSMSLIQIKMKVGFNMAKAILHRLIEGGAVLQYPDGTYRLAPEFFGYGDLE